MTRQKHFKQLVRARMAKTGESYSTARRQILGAQSESPPKEPTGPHYPGNIPGATALRIALTCAGARDPRTKLPFTEAAAFGIAGGIGIGVCSFVYAKEDIATFFIAGRHRWHDDLAYLQTAAERLGIEPAVEETTSPKKAAATLARVLAEHGPCIAWVDAASLPYRAMPTYFLGGGYHIVTVYSIEGDAALIGDLTDEPISVPLDRLAESRSRIKKQKNRLLYLPAAQGTLPLAEAMRGGLRASIDGLSGKFSPAGFASSFSLEALRRWGEQLNGLNKKESWEVRFAPGGRLWQGLTGIHDYIEHYGTGGGLCRPLFAAFLAESAGLLGGAGWRPLAARYGELGRRWSELADLALPDGVPMFRSAKQLFARKAELIHGGGTADEIGGIWQELGQLSQQAKTAFPLSSAECSELRSTLGERVLALYEEETAALQELGRLLG